MTTTSSYRLLMTLLMVVLFGCREPPNPRAIDVKNDPRIKRVEVTTDSSGAIGKK